MSSARKKAIVSACLIGEFCRYDGETKRESAVMEALSEYEIIPFCPEAPLFGTPRERISVVEVNGENRIVTDETRVDVTSRLENEINAFIKLHPSVNKIVLKSKSPSCGHGTTPIINDKKEVVKFGDGIAAKILSERFEEIEIEDELFYISGEGV